MHVVLHIKPFRVKKNWYIVVEWKMYGPFATKERAREVYDGGVKRSEARRKGAEDGERK